MEILYTHTIGNWFLIMAATFILGLAKAGLKGIDMLNVHYGHCIWRQSFYRDCIAIALCGRYRHCGIL